MEGEVRCGRSRGRGCAGGLRKEWTRGRSPLPVRFAAPPEETTLTPCPSGYYTIMRESKDPRLLRLRLVQYARDAGVKPAARVFHCSTHTVRKWLRRFAGTLTSLEEHSRAPHHPPRQLTPSATARILQAKAALPTHGVRRLKRDAVLPHTPKTIAKVLRAHNLLRRWRRKKHVVKRSLRAIKRLWAAWQQLSLDTKDLCDLPEYLLQARLFGLPLYQYTARDCSTGALFLAFAEELSLTYSNLFVQRLLTHLQALGTDTSRITVQTDNGSEFVGSWQATTPSAFTRTVESFRATHRTIPPGQHRYQADVETVHSLMETEFYLEQFSGPADFLAKAAQYQLFFNYLRPNSYKEDKCPWQLLTDKLPRAGSVSLKLTMDPADIGRSAGEPTL